LRYSHFLWSSTEGISLYKIINRFLLNIFKLLCVTSCNLDRHYSTTSDIGVDLTEASSILYVFFTYLPNSLRAGWDSVVSTDWTYCDSETGGGEKFRTRPEGPQTIQPSGQCVPDSFPGSKASRVALTPCPFQAQ
jgi:hypothetical protein